MSTDAATDSPSVTTEQRGNVLVVNLDDGKANAVTFELADAITAAMQQAEAADDIGAVVLNGRPGKFSAGFHLPTVTGEQGPEAARGLVAAGGQLVHTLYGASVPVVAACTGHALAAGAMILCGCDVRVGADDDSKIGMTEVAIGMALPEWAITILVERLSRRHLQLSAATARVYTPAEAIDAGFLDEVVAPDAVFNRALEVATGLAETLDPRAYATTVARLRRPMLTQLATDVADYRQSGEL